MRGRKIFALLLAIALILPLCPKYQVNANDSFSLSILEDDADTLRLMWSPADINNIASGSALSIDKIDILEMSTPDGLDIAIIDTLYDSSVTSITTPKPTMITYYQLKVFICEDGTGNAVEVLSSIAMYDPPTDGGISELINVDVFKNLSVTDITSNSVTVKFDSAIDFRINEKANRYIMQYFVQKVDGDLPLPINTAVSVTDSTEAGCVGCYFTVTGLEPNTDYVLWLRGFDLNENLYAAYLLKSFNTGISAGNLSFTVGSNVSATRGQTVTVPITVNNNPGFSAVGLAVTYDANVLEIINVTAPISAMPLNTEFALTGTPGTQWIHLVNPTPADWNGNGVVVNITFNVKTTAALGINPISLVFTSAPDGTPGNVNGDILMGAAAVSGSVNVASNLLCGDLSGDGVVDSADLILMLKYFAQPGTVINLVAADVNGDGTVNSADLILFLKYFAQPGIVLGSQ